MLGKSLFISPEKGILRKKLRIKEKARECLPSGGYRNGAGEKFKGELIKALSQSGGSLRKESCTLIASL